MTSPAFVATFVVAASRPTLSDAFLQRAAQVSGATGTRWLGAGVAADLFFFRDGDIAAVRERLEALAREAHSRCISHALVHTDRPYLDAIEAYIGFRGTNTMARR